MQTDSDNVHGRRLLDQLAAIAAPVECANEWAELQSWNGNETIDSRAALLFQVWQRRHLRPWLVDHCLKRLDITTAAAEKARHRLLRDDTLFSDLRPDLRMLAMFDNGDDEDLALLRAGVGQTLSGAVAEIEGLLGSDRAVWTWGALHQTHLRHPVLADARDIPSEWGTLPGVPRAGSGDTVGLTGYDAEFNAVMGSSFRMAIDVGAWDESRVVNAPGQSGDPRSQHYADLHSTWAAGGSFPLLYSRPAVEAAANQQITLRARISEGSVQE